MLLITRCKSFIAEEYSFKKQVMIVLAQREKILDLNPMAGSDLSVWSMNVFYRMVFVTVGMLEDAHTTPFNCAFCMAITCHCYAHALHYKSSNPVSRNILSLSGVSRPGNILTYRAIYNNKIFQLWAK